MVHSHTNCCTTNIIQNVTYIIYNTVALSIKYITMSRKHFKVVIFNLIMLFPTSKNINIVYIKQIEMSEKSVYVISLKVMSFNILD